MQLDETHMTGGEALVEGLIAHGVDTAFALLTAQGCGTPVLALNGFQHFVQR